MGFILSPFQSHGQLRHLVWLEPVEGVSDYRITVATTMGVIASGVGRLGELESATRGMGGVVQAGDLWLERTAEGWRLMLPTLDVPPLVINELELGWAADHLRAENGLDPRLPIWN